MTNPTVSVLCRNIQSRLDTTNDLLRDVSTLARDIGLAPFRIANIQAAINDNEHAWQELNCVATALEIVGPDLRPSDAGLTLLKGT